MGEKKSISALVSGGEASAGPPLGPALGPMGINVLQVVNMINEKTRDFPGMKVPVKVEVDPETKKFTVEVGICLLYTSPSPRDRQKSRMPSSA